RRAGKKSTSSARKRCLRISELFRILDKNSGELRCPSFSALASAMASRFSTRLDDAAPNPLRLRTERSELIDPVIPRNVAEIEHRCLRHDGGPPRRASGPAG